jgi:hypothetical protein
MLCFKNVKVRLEVWLSWSYLGSAKPLVQTPVPPRKKKIKI